MTPSRGISVSRLSPKDAKKLHWLVTMVLVVLVALLAAKLVTAMINLSLADLDTAEAPKKKTSLISEQNLEALRLARYDVIVTRNLFNSKNEIPEDVVVSKPGEATRPSTMDIELVGTIVVNEPSRSVAAIMIRSTKKVEPFIIGDTVLNKATVQSISRRRVVFKDNSSGDLEYIEMKGDDYTPAGAPGPVPAAGVKQIGEGRVLLERAELNRSLSDINSLLSQARAVPNFEGGRISGFKLFDIQPGSLYQKLGAINGDVIKSVNGVEIKDPATAMSLFQKLQSTSKLDFTINRGGETKNYSVEIR